MIVASAQQLDITDGVQLRTYYESLRAQLEGERSSWINHWQQLAKFILPRNQKFNYSDSNKGNRLDTSIVDNTATIAHRTLRAGLAASICSPTRKWRTTKTNDLELNKQKEVKIWLEHVDQVVDEALLKSNFYQTAHQHLGDMGLYGTSAFSIMEDEETDFRCYPWPIGSYCLAGNESRRIDLHLRIVQMTVRQIVGEFGFENCSQQVQQMYTTNTGGQKENWYPVVHIVHRSGYLGGKSLLPDQKPWASIWYELGAYGNDAQSKGNYGLLRKSGFYECPIIATRWDVIGEDFYGISPGMDALGDTMGLQHAQKRKMEAIDKMVKPPMVASPSMVNQKMTLLPGDITFADTREGGNGFKPAFEMRFDVADAVADIRDHQRRINDALYVNLFLMLANSDRREVTAEEIRAKQEEKMLVIGPVLERSTDEFLAPAMRRVLGILSRKGKFKAPPEALSGKKITFEFSSILAQVQRMMGVANLDRFMATVGQEAAVNQGIFDLVDLDAVARTYADLLDVPGVTMRDDKEVAAIRQQKQQQAMQAQQAENAQKLAMAAKNLSGTDTSGQNGLTDLIHARTGI